MIYHIGVLEREKGIVIMVKLMQLNKKRFIEEILNVDFRGDVKNCAVALGLDPNYFNQMLMIPTKKGGSQLLSGVYAYCQKTKRNPELFIFKD